MSSILEMDAWGSRKRTNSVRVPLHAVSVRSSVNSKNIGSRLKHSYGRTCGSTKIVRHDIVGSRPVGTQTRRIRDNRESTTADIGRRAARIFAQIEYAQSPFQIRTNFSKSRALDQWQQTTSRSGNPRPPQEIWTERRALNPRNRSNLHGLA
jgi:hypothetical protein